MKITFNLNQSSYLNNITMRGATKNPHNGDTAPIGKADAPKLNTEPREDEYTPMRGNMTKFRWAKVENTGTKDKSLTPAELMKMKDVPFFKDSPAPIEAQTELDDAVDYWYATFKKPGNAAEFATMCLKYRKDSTVADRLSERALGNLEHKIDFSKLGGRGTSLNEEENIKLGALFEYFNSDSDGVTRFGVRRPSYIKSESEYLESLLEADSIYYTPEKERIERKRKREEITKEDVRDSWAHVKTTPVEMYEKATGQTGETAQKAALTQADIDKLNKVAFSILILNHPRMIGNQYTDDGIGLRGFIKPTVEEPIDFEEMELREKYAKEFEEMQARWDAWKKKPLKYRIQHRSEKPPYPQIRLTQKQREEIRESKRDNSYNPSEEEGPGVKWYDMI